MTPMQYTLLSVFIVSLVSLVGVFFLSFKTELLKKMLMYLVSFSTGALLGNVFLHLIPEVIQENQENLIWVLGGILFSFVIEKFIHWRHCHDLECTTHVHPVGPLVIIGDAVHNILDGILIATAYLVSIPVGISTTIAVLLHEIPQELGDFAILIHSGMSKGKALLFNFFSALTAFIGVGIVIGLSQSIANIEMILLPLAAGNFLYIAGSDLIPELHKDTRLKGAAIQLTMMIVGIGLMYGLSL
jgi:zinc and cadmium transporter